MTEDADSFSISKSVSLFNHWETGRAIYPLPRCLWIPHKSRHFMKYCLGVGRHQLISDPPLSPPLQEEGDKETSAYASGKEKKRKSARDCTVSSSWSLSLFITSSTAVSREVEATPVWKFGIICQKSSQSGPMAPRHKDKTLSLQQAICKLRDRCCLYIMVTTSKY